MEKGYKALYQALVEKHYEFSQEFYVVTKAVYRAVLKKSPRSLTP